MTDELGAMIAKVAELHGRAAEINRRIQHDAHLLVAVQQELSTALTSLGQFRQAPVAPAAPVGPTQVKDRECPRPRRLSPRTVGWLEEDVSAWLMGRAGEAEPVAPKARRRRP